jgi:tetratricopeptide (TPR) repeat protein
MFYLPVLLLCASPALAHIVADMEMGCPLCQTTFKAQLALSGTVRDVRLDLKPLGPIYAPDPVPVCPECHFVLYGRSKEMAEAELERCRQIVASKSYKNQANRASYYLMGILFEGLGKDDSEIAWTYLKASWQEEGRGSRCREDMEKSFGYFKAHLAKANEHNEAWQNAQIVTGELLRRLRRFSEAKAHFLRLSKMEEFQKDKLSAIIEYQLELVGYRDSNPHTLSEMEGKARILRRYLYPILAIILVVLLGIGFKLTRKSKRRQANLADS